MKRIIIMALAFSVSATFISATAQGKKEKKDKARSKSGQVAKLVTRSDSVSYALGVNMTQGLLPYLQSSQGIDTVLVSDVIKGFEDGLKQKSDPKFKAYNAGVLISTQVEERMLPDAKQDFEGTESSINSDLFYKGFLDALKKQNKAFDMKAAETYVKEARTAVSEAKNKQTRLEGEAFLAENAKKEGVVVLPSGLQYKVLREGTGAVAKENDMVTVKYEGHLVDGTEFDSSYKRNPQTTDFRPNQVIKGWTEALTIMPEGSKWELYIPQELAYGARQAGKIPAYSTLIFTVELEAVKAEKTETAKEEEKDETPVKPKIHPKKRK